MRTQALSAIFLGGLFALSASGQGNTGPRTTEVKKAATLEDDIARAVQSHPDVRVAEAEAQLANAKLQQTKQAVAQRVAAAKREKDRAAEELTLAKKSYEAAFIASAKIGEQVKTMQKLGGAAGRLEMIQLETTLQQYEVTKVEHERAMAAAKAKLATAEADYVAMVGTTTTVYLSLNAVRTAEVSDAEKANLVNYLNTIRKPQAPTGSVAEKLRKSLSVPITYGCKNLPIMKVIEELKKAAGLDVIVRTPTHVANCAVHLSFDKQELPLSAWLELIRDEIDELIIFDNKPSSEKKQPGRTTTSGNVEWYIRDYGLLFSEFGRPDGVLTLAEFLNTTRAEKPADPKK